MDAAPAGSDSEEETVTVFYFIEFKKSVLRNLIVVKDQTIHDVYLFSVLGGHFE